MLYWLEQDVAEMAPGYAWLTGRERRVLSCFSFTRRRNSWRHGRWTAKLAVAGRLMEAAEGTAGRLVERDVEILAAPDGAPEAFIANRRAPVNVSISHSGTRAVCAVVESDSVVGCDVETIEERGVAFVRDYFTSGELAFWRGCRVDERAIAETLLWSAKESALKALRDGLRRDTRDVQVVVEDFPADNRWNRLAVSLPDDWCGDARPAGGLSRLDGWWRSRNGFVYTVVADRPMGVPRTARASRR